MVLALVTRDDLVSLIESYVDLAEFRLAKETTHFFAELSNREQVAWVNNLLGRVTAQDNPTVSVCILDTGVNNQHPLLKRVLSDRDCLTYDPTWGTHDHDGHGTLMSGVAAYGDLQGHLEGSHPVEVPHGLESVKILPPQGQNEKKLWGYITSQAVSEAEIQAPDRQRVVCMAVTATDDRDRGRPTSWSAKVDAISSGYDDNQRRLFVISAGNIEDQNEWKSYPDSNLTNSLHDPAQAWNAVTVGAYTRKIRTTDPNLEGYQPVAPADGLSPFSPTSLTWETKLWPAKPDIVLEGGNVLRAPDGWVSSHDDVSILSTYHQPTHRHFGLVNATSAATAQAAWLAAQIQASYPQAWPETVRALLVHSADWTDQMKQDFLAGDTKTGYARLLRVCGYGVPNFARAMECGRSYLTLIAQEEIQPFEKTGSSRRTKEMHLFELPWPREVLLELGEVEVTLRVTLSYFIEPGPGEVGWQNRYKYASHALRFDINSFGESRGDFEKRINAASREEDHDSVGTSSGSERWTIGANGRKLGSVHSDIWVGNAAEIATCNLAGVYPVVGWWRERHYLNRCNRRTRYSLVVSLSTPEQSVDLYTPVAVRIRVPIPV